MSVANINQTPCKVWDLHHPYVYDVSFKIKTSERLFCIQLQLINTIIFLSRDWKQESRLPVCLIVAHADKLFSNSSVSEKREIMGEVRVQKL